VDDYLKKPVSLLELHAALTRLTPSADPPIDPVERARRMMTEHPDGAHTTESLGRQVGLSSRHFRRRFLEATGKTPRRFLTEARMQQAAELLRTTTLGIEQVAQTVGYLNFAAFDRMFKRAFGLTPTEWRASRDPSSHRKTEG
jgi:transcriptional regulator GlxA family with amidase domain